MKCKFRNCVIVILALVIVAILFCVYGIGGMIAAVVWSGTILVIAPICLALCLVRVISIIVSVIKKRLKKRDFLILTQLSILAFPILILVGVVFWPYPTNTRDLPSVTMGKPIESEIVMMGGQNYQPHAIWPSECYAYDILMSPYNINSKKLDEYGIWDKDIFATIKGKVIAVHDGEEDIVPNSEQFTSSMGNYIYLKVEKTGTYLIYAHLKKDSITVKEGDVVSGGEIIGKVGNSGTTSEPHLHLQHQRNNPLKMIYPTCAEGLPIRFNDKKE